MSPRCLIVGLPLSAVLWALIVAPFFLVPNLGTVAVNTAHIWVPFLFGCAVVGWREGRAAS